MSPSRLLFTDTLPSLSRLTMISPGRRSGSSAVDADGSLIVISFSHCEKTLTVTKKHSNRKMTSSIDVSASCGAFDLFILLNFISQNSKNT